MKLAINQQLHLQGQHLTIRVFLAVVQVAITVRQLKVNQAAMYKLRQLVKLAINQQLHLQGQHLTIRVFLAVVQVVVITVQRLKVSQAAI